MSNRKVALVTGSATGIGRAVAWQLAEQGTDIVVNYTRSENEARQTADGVQERGGRAVLCQCDVSDEDGVSAMVARAEAELGGIDFLVNNAGMTYFVDLGDLESMTTDQWDRIFAVNVKGAFYCFRECVPRMRKRGGGAVVNVSSVAALTGVGSSVAYAASKAALLNMTRSWARGFAPEIRVNAVLPGPVTTRWLTESHQDMIDGAIEQTPMQRVSSADDVADAVRHFLIGTDFVTGHWLVVDGGRTMP